MENVNKMTTAQEIARKVVDQYQYRRQTPVGKAQQQVLTALGITQKINGSSHAEQIFEALGLVVTARREGRASVPVVQLRSSNASGWNTGGDADEINEYRPEIDLTGVRHWMS
jgi:hypothetical protein